MYHARERGLHAQSHINPTDFSPPFAYHSDSDSGCPDPSNPIPIPKQRNPLGKPSLVIIIISPVHPINRNRKPRPDSIQIINRSPRIRSLNTRNSVLTNRSGTLIRTRRAIIVEERI